MMKQQNKKEPSLEQNININNKKDIQALIRNLVKRREQHEARIEKLVGSSYPSRDATKESIKPVEGSEFSDLLQQLDNNQAIQPGHIHQSAGTFGSHVNLLATVSLKTEYFLAEKVQNKESGHLYTSIKQELGKCNIKKNLGKEELNKECPEALKQIVDFLTDEQLEEDLFSEVQSLDKRGLDYFATRFVLGRYEEIQLSKQTLKKQEKSLISVIEYQDLRIAKIGLLLLKRLLNETKQSSFPAILHTLFSYPMKSFHIRQSLQLIEFNELIKDLAGGYQQKIKEEESHIKIFGVEEKSGYSYEIENLSKSKNIKYFAPILHRFKKLILINQQELPVKHLPLSCLQNHFAIVSMNVFSKGEYFISVGSSSTSKRFRVFIIDLQGKVVRGEVLNGGQFIYCKLKQEEYEVYVNPIPEEELSLQDLEESYELVTQSQENFTFWIQSKQLYSKNGELSLEIRLKQQYNHCTSKIAFRYLKSSNSQKQVEELSHSLAPNQLIIRRDVVSGLNLVIDTFLLQEPSSITVTYKGTHMMTDNFFQQNQATIANGQSLVLYKQSEIQKVSIQRKGIQQSTDYSLVQYYI